MPASVKPHTELSRDLGLGHAGAVVVGTVIGTGIFLVPSEMMQAVGSAWVAYLVWIVGGLLSLFGALTYAELAAMKPQAGGEYVYIRDAYGALPAFLYAWTWFLIAKPASIATITTGLVRILGTFSAFGFLQHNLLTSPVTVNYGQIVAIAFVLLISFLNYIGVRKAGDFQLVMTLIKVAVVLGTVVIGATYSKGSWANFTGTAAAAKGGAAGFMAALVAVLWAYDGWNDLTMVSGEVRDPERNIPAALVRGMATVAALYILMNAAVQYVLPASAIAASPRPASDAIAVVLGPMGARFIAVGMAVSMLVTLNGTIMSGARVPFAVARDGHFFSALAQVHPIFRTPSTALIVQMVLAVALLLAGGSFRQFFALAIFAEWLFYMVAASTVFVFRKKEALSPRPYTVWGYPVVPALFIMASAVLLYYTFTGNVRNSLLGTLVIAAGIPVFLGFRRYAHT